MTDDAKTKKEYLDNASDEDPVAGPLVFDTLDVVPSSAGEASSDNGGEATQIDLNRNVSGTITNPLQGIPHDKLLSRAAHFSNSHGLQDHLSLIQRGALVAQSPHSWNDIPELSPEEREALDYEQHHKWSMTPALIFTIFVCGLGALTQGWDQTGSSGANLTMGVILGIPTGQDPSQPDYSSNSYNNTWLLGLVNAGPYLGASLCGCWITDYLNLLWGRRGALFISAIILVITPICSGLTQKWWELLIVRLLLGVGMGVKASTAPVFCAENAPARIRGSLTLNWQMLTAFGIFIGTIANLIVRNTGRNMAWRLQLGSAFIPAVPLSIFSLMLCESPRWLIKKGRYSEAMRSLQRLRKHPILAARDLYYMHVLLEAEKSILDKSTAFKRFTELFTVPRARRATVAAGVVTLCQQLCGINIIAFYSSTVFKVATGSDDKALFASVGFGALNFVFCIPAIWLIDRIGRRPLLLWTFPGMAISLLATGLCFLIPDDAAHNQVRLGLIALFIYLFTCFYSPGEGPVPFVYSAEVFPLSVREVGMAWAVAVCFFFSAILSICWPAQLAVFTPTGAFGFFAGLNVLSIVLIFLFVRETSRLTLEEIDQVFAIPQSVYIGHLFRHVLPFYARRYLLWDRTAVLKPLVHLDHSLREPEGTDVYLKEKDDDRDVKA